MLLYVQHAQYEKKKFYKFIVTHLENVIGKPVFLIINTKRDK